MNVSTFCDSDIYIFKGLTWRQLWLSPLLPKGASYKASLKEKCFLKNTHLRIQGSAGPRPTPLEIYSAQKHVESSDKSCNKEGSLRLMTWDFSNLSGCETLLSYETLHETLFIRDATIM